MICILVFTKISTFDFWKISIRQLVPGIYLENLWEISPNISLSKQERFSWIATLKCHKVTKEFYVNFGACHDCQYSFSIVNILKCINQALSLILEPYSFFIFSHVTVLINVIIFHTIHFSLHNIDFTYFENLWITFSTSSFLGLPYLFKKLY